MTDERKPIVIIAGPTAVGKTASSILLAKKTGGEIISCDSMQVYRGMDIGSAKVTAEEADGVPHHLIDVLDPTEPFDVARFQKMAKEALAKVYGRGRLPILAGGTGFYIQAVLRDIDFTETAGDPAYREELNRFADENGNEALHARLAEVDPESARAIHFNNRKRVVRALEYFRETGETISKHNEEERAKKSPYRFAYFFLDMDREKLYERIEKRVDLMLEAGLLDEVKALRDAGMKKTDVSMQGLGYKEILAYLDGECTLEEAVAKLKLETRHFAKRQVTWFSHTEDVIRLDVDKFGRDPEKLADEMYRICLEKGIL